MRHKTITLTLAAADADAICASQKPTEAGNMTINGALATSGVATCDYARHLTLTSSGNDSGVTFTVTGTDRYGKTLTETTLGPNTTTKTLTKNFLTVTQIAVDQATTGNITVGTGDEAETQVVPVDRQVRRTSVQGSLSSGAGLTYDVQYTLDDPFSSSFNEHTANWSDIITEKTDLDQEDITSAIRAVRAKVYSYSSGTLTLDVVAA